MTKGTVLDIIDEAVAGAETGAADRVTPWDIGVVGTEEPITGDGVVGVVIIIGTPGDCVDVTVAIRVLGVPTRRFPRLLFRLAPATTTKQITKTLKTGISLL